jgi:hypothetical protein
MAGRPAALYPQEDSWYSFLSEAESGRNIVKSGRNPQTFRSNLPPPFPGSKNEPSKKTGKKKKKRDKKKVHERGIV